jgi:hypothetical protein
VAITCNASDRTPSIEDTYLGRYGHYDLFVAEGEQDRFVEFTLFILAASTQTDAATAAAAGGSSGAGKSAKATTPQPFIDVTSGQLSIPAGP